MKHLLLKNISDVYGQPKGVHSIFIRDGVIQAVAPFAEIERTWGPALKEPCGVLDCSRLTAVPGFVDGHTHLLFAGSREDEFYLRASGEDYLSVLNKGGGLHQTVNAVRRASGEELLRNGLAWLDLAFGFGTTTIEIKSGYGLDLETERKMLKILKRMDETHPVDVVPTFLVHAVPKDMGRRKYLDLVENAMIPEFREYASWFDLFLEKDVFDLPEAERLLRKAKDAGYKIGLHTNQVFDIKGVSLAVDMGARHVDHLEVLSPGDAALIMGTAGLYAVFLPSAEIHAFSEKTGRIDLLMEMPDRLVLSTNFNPGTSPVLSPAAVMAMAVWRYRLHDPRLMVEAFTRNPADMLFLHDRGRIETGARADLVLFALDHAAQIPYYGTICPAACVVKNGACYQIGKPHEI